MNLADYLAEIESIEFQTRFSVISGLKIMMLALSHDDTLSEFIRFLRNSPSSNSKVYQQMVYLIDSQATSNSLSSFDESITAYLYVLSQADAELVQRAILSILSVENLWWANRVAQKIYENLVGTTVTVISPEYNTLNSMYMSSNIQIVDFSSMDTPSTVIKPNISQKSSIPILTKIG